MDDDNKTKDTWISDDVANMDSSANDATGATDNSILKASLSPLPYELAFEIFKYFLVVDHEIIPYLSLYEISKRAIHDTCKKRRYNPWPLREKPSLPSLNLLLVNTQVREMALSILYGENTWRRYTDSSTFWSPWEHNIFQIHRFRFNHISLRFDWREIAYHTLQDHINKADCEPGSWADHGPLGMRKEEWEEFHGRKEKGYVNLLQYSELGLQQMVPHLKSLTIDVEDLYCPAGCCRRQVLHETFCYHFVGYLVKEILTRSLEIKVLWRGLRNSEEKKWVFEDWGFEPSGDIKLDKLKSIWSPTIKKERTAGESAENGVTNKDESGMGHIIHMKNGEGDGETEIREEDIQMQQHEWEEAELRERRNNLGVVIAGSSKWQQGEPFEWNGDWDGYEESEYTRMAREYANVWVQGNE